MFGAIIYCRALQEPCFFGVSARYPLSWLVNSASGGESKFSGVFEFGCFEHGDPALLINILVWPRGLLLDSRHAGEGCTRNRGYRSMARFLRHNMYISLEKTIKFFPRKESAPTFTGKHYSHLEMNTYNYGKLLISQ